MQPQLADAPTARERVRAELLADPGKTNRDIAELAGCARQTVQRTRRQLEAAGLVPVRASHRPPAWRAPSLPPMPTELAWGACVGHERADWWTSKDPADRHQAIRVCQGCPVRAICASWSLSLPLSDCSIWGGLSHTQRQAIRRQRAAAQAG
jgi:hypothetical protein